MACILFNTILILVLIESCRTTTWSYTGSTGPDNWSTISATCGLNSQSPVNIEDSQTSHDSSLGYISTTDYDVSLSSQTLTNNGHSVQLTIPDTRTISGGGLSGTYKAAQLHFHWGSVDTQGSEHTRNGNKYPMEIHIVHFKSTYADLATAVGNADGLAVLGAFFEVSDTANANYATLVSALSSVTAKDATTTTGGFSLNDLMFTTLSNKEFFRYSGSLTTPNCNEVVTWTVFMDTIPISSAQLASFRTLLVGASGTAAIEDNYRPVQTLNTRTVMASMDVSSATTLSSGLIQMFISFAALFYLLFSSQK